MTPLHMPPLQTAARLTRAMLTCVAVTLALPASADAPVVTEVSVHKEGMGWRFFVTLQHADTGWDHYVDVWDILDANGTVLATRKLHHPHVQEQPFTRSLGSVILPDGTREVFVRAHCSDGEVSKTLVRVAIGF
ncbi:hypothetical protein OO012_07515 [Rhodobacteraceae bacterium KMM 6894]|nr:hypothetical protein [Rhodobacteraceae bacterium KMM 6894]